MVVLGYQVHTIIITLTTTNIFPWKNGGWETILLGFGLFQGGELFVSGRAVPQPKKNRAPSNNLSKSPPGSLHFSFVRLLAIKNTLSGGSPRLRLKLWQSAATLCLSSPDDDGVTKNSGPVHRVLWRRLTWMLKKTHSFLCGGGDDYGKIRMRYLYVESRITSLTWRSQYIQYYSLPKLSLFLHKISFLTCKKCWDLKNHQRFFCW